MKKTILISVDIQTDKSLEEIQKALSKGIHYGLDVNRVSPPQGVEVTFVEEKNAIDALIDKAEQFLSFDDYDVLAEEIIALTKLEDTSASLDHTFGDDVCPIEKFEHCFTVGTFLEEIGYESN